MAIVSGIVRDSEQTALAGIIVTITAAQPVVGFNGGAVARQTESYTTNGAGLMTTGDLAPGAYRVTMSVAVNASTSQTVLLETTGVATEAATMTLEAFLAENALPVNTSILQQVLAAAAVALSAYQGRQYVTRALFVAATAYVNGADAPVNGTVVTAGGLQYVRSAGDTALPGLPGWLPFGPLSLGHFADVKTDSIVSGPAAAEAFTQAIAYAATARDGSRSYPNVKTEVIVPSGVYHFSAGTTAILRRGVRLRGQSRGSVRIYHHGGGVDCFSTVPYDAGVPDTFSNSFIEIEDIEIVGSSTTTNGIYIFGNVRNGALRRVTVRGCATNVGGNECYTLVTENCDFQAAVNYNVDFGNITSALFFENRIDEAGISNVRVTGSAAAPNVHVKFVGGHYQRAGEAGIRLVDVDSAVMIAPYFEGNNKDSGNFADVEWIHGPASRGRDLTILDLFGTATTGGTNTRIVKATTAGRLTIVGPKTFIGTAPGQYTVGVELGASMLACDLIGGRIDAATRVTRASNNTRLNDLAAGLEDLGSAGNRRTLTNGNLYWTLDSPANRRGEMRFAAGGADTWFVGRGRSDESIPGDFYIARASGGGASPDFSIDDGTGAVGIRRLVLPGPFADDAAAASGGVAVGASYRVTGGNVAWRVT